MSDSIWGSGRKPVQLIGINAPFEPSIQFGFLHQPDRSPRQDTFADSALSMRSADKEGIRQPAPIRQQTAWAGRLSPELQRQLRGGFNENTNQGRKDTNHLLPTLDSVAAPNHVYRQQTSFDVQTAATMEGKMTLRAVAASSF